MTDREIRWLTKEQAAKDYHAQLREELKAYNLGGVNLSIIREWAFPLGLTPRQAVRGMLWLAVERIQTVPGEYRMLLRGITGYEYAGGDSDELPF